MTKDIILKIVGHQFEVEDSEPIEVITTAEYYEKNGKHYIIYNEVISEDGAENRNTIKFNEQRVDLIKHGAQEGRMVFELDQKNICSYNTPFGDIILGISTMEIISNISEDEIQLEISYALEVNDVHMSNCKIKINAFSKESQKFQLQL